ncbi:MAG: ABC transporter permease [Pseudomonadota bacterium]
MLWETLVLAVQAILRNAVRSLLTVLGIVIGVAAVIAMVTVGQGSADQVTADVEKLGSNAVLIMPGQDAMRGGSFGVPAAAFTLKDNDAVEEISAVQVAAPINQTRERAVFGNENWRTDITGADNRYFEAAQWELASGRLFEDGELKSGRPVCIIGETVRAELFGESNPVGEKIRIRTMSCEVIGVTQSKGASTFGSDQDDFVIMPLKTFFRRIAGNTDVGIIFASIRDGASIPKAMDDISALMRERRRISLGDEDDFEVMDMEQLTTMLTSITGILTSLLAGVAAISLLVGGIGIMNIMLVSVTERTREIGIRLAVGAQASQVLMQFLVEAIVLSLLGGLLGIVLGLGIGLAGAHYLNVPFQPQLWVVLLAFGFSAAVGVVFGIFPAQRAARMNPIESLRHE